MIIEIITNDKTDTEVCVMCPNDCGCWWLDPRASPSHCEECSHYLRLEILTKCPICNDVSPPEGNGASWAKGQRP